MRKQIMHKRRKFVLGLSRQMAVALLIFESGTHFEFEKSRMVGRTTFSAVACVVVLEDCGPALIVVCVYGFESEAPPADTA